MSDRSEFTPATDKTVAEVLRRLADYCDLTEDDEDKKIFSVLTNDMQVELEKAGIVVDQRLPILCIAKLDREAKVLDDLISTI